MANVHETAWSRHFEALFQARLNEMQEMLRAEFLFDGTHLKVAVGVVQDSIIGRNSPYLFNLALERDGKVLFSVQLEDFEELESNRGLVEFLETVDGNRIPIGQIYKFRTIDLAANLETTEVQALTKVMTLLLHDISELVFGEEAEMARQPAALQEMWRQVYGPRAGNVVEYDGVKYIRFDDATSWHSF